MTDQRRKTIREILAECDALFEEEEPGPVEKSPCQGCDFPDGHHRFSCYVGGVRAGQIILPAIREADGTVRILPLPEVTKSQS